MVFITFTAHVVFLLDLRYHRYQSHESFKVKVIHGSNLQHNTCGRSLRFEIFRSAACSLYCRKAPDFHSRFYFFMYRVKFMANLWCNLRLNLFVTYAVSQKSSQRIFSKIQRRKIPLYMKLE